MADQLRIDWAEVGAVADGLAGLSARMTEHASGLEAHVADAGAPWGSDETGELIAGGPDGFVAQLQQWLQKMRTHAETLQHNADGLAARAAVFQQADQA